MGRDTAARDFMEAIMELQEEDRLCICPYCLQMETLSFINTRLSSGLKKWKQLPNGSVIHLCELNPALKEIGGCCE